MFGSDAEDEYHDFFLAAAGASAALTGLLIGDPSVVAPLGAICGASIASIVQLTK